MSKQTIEKKDTQVKEGRALESTIYFNGKFVPESEAVISIKTHAFQYGTGIFEGIRAYWNDAEKKIYVFKMKEHYERMLKNAKILMLESPKSVDELCNLTIELLKKNQPTEDTYIRPNIYKSGTTIGPSLINKDGNNPAGLSIYTISLGNYVDISKGLHVCVSSWKRLDDNALPPRGKIQGSYVNAALAKSDAVLSGYDDAIVLTHDGHITEGSAMNLFLIRDGKLITSTVADNILEGITRDTIITLAKEELGIETVERKIDRSELYIADELFFCGTGAQVSPITKVDNREIGNGQIGEVSKKLQDIYFKVVRGENKKYTNWLTPVN